MKEVLKDMNRITVLDDDDTEVKGSTNYSTIPRTDGKVTSHLDANQPSCSDIELTDRKTPSTSSSSHQNSETNKSDDVKTGDTTGVRNLIGSDISSSSVTQTKKLPTILSNREVYENIDNIPRPSYWLPETEPDSEKKEEEIDDFEYLGMLDDGYLLSLFDEDKEDDNAELVCSEKVTETEALASVSQTDNTSGTDKITRDEDFTTPVTQAAAGEVSKNRRSNPPRLAKEGVIYRDDIEDLEEVLQSEYCKSTFCSLPT